MKIEYVWYTDPKRKRVYDTETSFNRCPISLKKSGQTQEEWDKQEIESFEKNKKRGLVLEYKVID